uniref:Uncharacterized protein n=1 Tax=Ciona savignyi TaxID=51511 RepID=H2YBS4_CIOSA
MMDASSSSDLASVNGKKNYAEKSLRVGGISGINSVEDGKAKFEKSKISSADTGDSGTTVAKRAPTNVITFPKLRDVSNDRHHVNLSTGRALIGRKVDCWLTFEEYEKLTSSPESTLRREKSIPNSFWPGHLLDKLRLCLTPSDNPTLPKCGAVRSRTTVFQPIQPHNVHRSNYGYNNNEITWPTSGNYVKYGNVDLRKVYHI